jgi:long-chain fatty acid transport protein
MMTFRAVGIGIAMVLGLASVAGTAAAQSNDGEVSNLQWNFSTPGARANGMGRTFIGIADDATASVTNPAGLVNLTRPQIYGEYKNSRLTFDRLSASNSLTTRIPTSTNLDVSALSFASASAPLGSRLAVGFSVYRFLDYHENINLAARPIPGTDSTFFPVTGRSDFTGTSYGGSFAFLVTKDLRLGATVAINQLDASSVATRTGIPGDTVRPANIIANRVGVDDNQTAPSATVGALYRLLGDKLTVGASYTKSPQFTIQQSKVVNQSTTTNDNLVASDGFPKPVDLNVPDHFGAGISFRATPRLLIAGDAVRTTYSSLSKTTTLVFFVDAGVITGSDFVTPDVTELHLGAEYNVYSLKGNMVLVRGGVFTNPDHTTRYVPTTKPDRTAAEANAINTEIATYNLIPAKDETRGTLGVGIVIGRRTQFDIAYAVGGDFVASAAWRF